MKIIKLKIENVMRIKAVEITPDGAPVVTISGKNGAGKSTCLHSIAMAIGGKKFFPPKPVRRGQKVGKITLDLGDLKVHLQLGKNPKLIVTDKDGVEQKAPQTILNKLKGAVGFDAGEFARMKADKQLETLKALVGLDFTDLDKRRDAAYGKRHDVNLDLKSAEARLNNLPSPHVDVLDEEVSVAELARDLEARQAQNAENSEMRRELATMRSSAIALKAEEADLEKRLKTTRAKRAKTAEEGRRLAAEVEKLEDQDVEAARAKIANAEGANRKVRENKARAALDAEVAELVRASEGYTTAIEEIDAEKEKLVATADMPIDGLGLGEEGVTLDGLPLEQAASSEKYRLSVAIGLALNPDFKFVMIENANLLDEDSKRMVAEMTAKAGGEVWMEVVDSDDPSAVIIEDGMVKAAEPAGEEVPA